MGWISRRRRKRLQKELLEQGKLDTYRKRLNQYVTSLKAKEKEAVERIKKVKDEDAYQAKILIQQVQEYQALIKRIQRVNGFLDNYATKHETADIYEDFLKYLNEANKSSGKVPSKSKNRRAMNKSQRKIKDLNQLFDYIDKKIGNFEKHDLAETPKSAQSLESIDVDEFLKTYE